ncbi:MAG TPA: glycerol-3-phosphate 1-O-acyltransferase PlsY [Burkholderiaceae bacterium]|nr:glycerol-3-phosphate 1-O-acyltransferase PlsY [Burkholderiaceae bacterium]
MIDSLLMAAIVVAAYFLGSLPFAVIVSRLMGLRDPRQHGSGNPGATNVLRTGNRKAAALTLLGDIGKGWLAVAAGQWLATSLTLSSALPAWCGLAVFAGHVWPIFLRFRGGKGVATALGVLLGINIWLAVATAATWLIVARAGGYSSLAAILAAIFAPLYFILGSNVAWPANGATAVMLVIMSVTLLFRHRDNISRLMRGKETRIGQTSPGTSAPGQRGRVSSRKR